MYKLVYKQFLEQSMELKLQCSLFYSDKRQNTIDQIFTLRQLQEIKALKIIFFFFFCGRQFSKESCYCHKVRTRYFLKDDMTLERNSLSFVKLGKNLFEPIASFRQDDLLSCNLFNFIVDIVLRMTFTDMHRNKFMITSDN